MDLHVQPVIRDDSHSLAWETEEPRALKVLSTPGLGWAALEVFHEHTSRLCLQTP